MIESGHTRWIGVSAGAAVVALASAALLSPTGKGAAMPGPLASAHGRLAEDCSACHAESADALQSLAHDWSPTSLDLDQSRRCGECHELGPDALSPHGWPSDRLAEYGNWAEHAKNAVPMSDQGEIACASCHAEHRGRDAALAQLDDGRCQACHEERYSGLAEHPEFVRYPSDAKTNIGFDHASHLLRHFPADELGRSPDACTSCHALDASGRHMPVRSYEESCAACHTGDILGATQVEGAGLAVLALPALDTLTLEERAPGIGRWPADSMVAEIPVSPFLALLLSADREVAVDLPVIEALDLYDLTGASDAELVAVTRFAWGVKRLIHDLAERGHDALTERLAHATDAERVKTSAADLVLHLPEDLVRDAARNWLPGLGEELERHGEGEDVPTDSTLPELESGTIDAERDERRENWVRTGGWYSTELDFSLRYRPGSHTDAFLRSWLDLTATESTPSGRTLFEELADPSAMGRCTKCHAVVGDPGNYALRWEAASGSIGGSTGLERFSHVAHFASADDNACLACHVLDRSERDFMEPFQDRDPAAHARSFETMTRQTCLECHFESGASESCLTCHDYHARSERWSRSPRASLEALLRQREVPPGADRDD